MAKECPLDRLYRQRREQALDKVSEVRQEPRAGRKEKSGRGVILIRQRAAGLLPLRCESARTDPIHARLVAAITGRRDGGAAAIPMLSETTWPAYNPEALIQSTIELVVQVNGKLRDRLMVDKDIDEEGAKAAAFASSKVNEHLEGKTIRKIVFIPGKIFNIVAN